MKAPPVGCAPARRASFRAQRLVQHPALNATRLLQSLSARVCVQRVVSPKGARTCQLTRGGVPVSKIADRLFRSIELNAIFGIHSADDLWRFVVDGAREPTGGRAAPLYAGPTVVYRGQADAAYALSSSLYRLCRAALGEARVTEAHLQDAEQAIIRATRAEGIGRRMTDGELLMVLQHHGIPTRLIDVSALPLEALFFAVDRNDASPGRLFVVDLHDDKPLKLAAPGPHGPISAEERTLPWAGSARGGQSASAWTDRVALVDEAPLDPRMWAQAGKFLVGGLNRRYGGRAMHVRGVRPEQVAADDFPEVTTLSINFIQQRRAWRNGSWPATGWTLRVEPDWKPELRMRLSKIDDPISADTMYPPLVEVRRLAIVEAQRAVRRTVLPPARSIEPIPVGVESPRVVQMRRTWPPRQPVGVDMGPAKRT